MNDQTPGTCLRISGGLFAIAASLIAAVGTGAGVTAAWWLADGLFLSCGVLVLGGELADERWRRAGTTAAVTAAAAAVAVALPGVSGVALVAAAAVAFGGLYAFTLAIDAGVVGHEERVGA